MNPDQARIKRSYFLDKLEILIINHQIKSTGEGLNNIQRFRFIEQFLENNNIDNNQFWGFSIEKATNGLKSFEIKQNLGKVYFFMLFKLEFDYLHFYPLKLDYTSEKLEQILPPFKLSLKNITKTSYGGDASLYIYSDELDDVLILKTDHVKNARYYSGSILKLRDEKIDQLGLEEENKIVPLDSYLDNAIGKTIKPLKDFLNEDLGKKKDNKVEIPIFLPESKSIHSQSLNVLDNQEKEKLTELLGDSNDLDSSPPLDQALKNGKIESIPSWGIWVTGIIIITALFYAIFFNDKVRPQIALFFTAIIAVTAVCKWKK